jgi:uncharacterized membrane protein YeaQ/YmgE (transglycosylase-associated protein family)
VNATPVGYGHDGADWKESGMRLTDTNLALSVPPIVAARVRFNIDLESVVIYILIGVVVGLVARFLVPGRDPIGLLGTILIGIVGALIGGWLAGNVFEETRGIDWIASIAVAIVLVLLVRAASRRRRLI